MNKHHAGMTSWSMRILKYGFIKINKTEIALGGAGGKEDGHSDNGKNNMSYMKITEI